MKRLKFNVKDFNITTDTIGVSGASALTVSKARDSIDSVDEAIARVSGARASLGAMQNKLVSTTNTIGIATENLEQARSRIADTDIAEETTTLAQKQILQQAGIAVLAQANSSQQLALKLL